MKLLNKIKETPFVMEEQQFTPGNGCSVVGSSGNLLDNEYGIAIDTNDDVIRFNGAKTTSFEKHCGARTTFRLMNCHSILNLENSAYYAQQKERHPQLDRELLYKIEDEIIIFKTDPTWELWRKTHILDKVRQKNEVYFVHKDFYRLGNKLNGGKEATNGFIGLLMALKYYSSIDCYGFSFYEPGVKKHYFDEVNNYNMTAGHDFDNEKKIFALFEKSGIINIHV
jgi:hypothetical protein